MTSDILTNSSDGSHDSYSGPVNPSSWWWNKAKTLSRIRTGSPFSHLPKLWWGKTTKRRLFASYQQEIALAKIVLLGWGMKGMAWLWPSLGTSPDVWPASDPEPGLGRKAEGGQERVCIHGWAPPLRASLMGRQPSAWYVGMRAATAHADVRGFLNSTGADDCETGVATLLTSAHSVPLSLTIHLSSSERSEASRAWTSLS